MGASPCVRAWFQVSDSLSHRVTEVERSFERDMDHFEPRVEADFEMTLDKEPVTRAVSVMNFYQMKGTAISQTCTHKQTAHRTCFCVGLGQCLHATRY